MALSEMGGPDLEKLAGGLYSQSRSLRANVESDLNRLDVNRLSRMVEINEVNTSLCKPFAKAFGTAVLKAKAAAEMFEADYAERIPALRNAKQR